MLWHLMIHANKQSTHLMMLQALQAPLGMACSGKVYAVCSESRMLAALFPFLPSLHLCRSSQTEALQTPCALKTAQIQRLASTTLTQRLVISPHPMTTASNPTQAQPPALLLLLRQELLATRTYSQAPAVQMDEVALQQIRTGKARRAGMKSIKGQGSQLQMKLPMLIRMAGQPIWPLLLNKLISGKPIADPHWLLNP